MADSLSNKNVNMEGHNEASMLNEIASLGYDRPTITLLHHTKTSLDKEVVAIILKWLPSIYAESKGAGHHLLWSLLNSASNFDPSVLILLYEDSDLNDTLKQAIAIILSEAKVGDISVYVRNKLLRGEVSHAGVGFIFALEANCNFDGRIELMSFLKKIFHKYIYYEKVFLLYKKYGWITDLEFLDLLKMKINSEKDLKKIDTLINFIVIRKKEPIFKLTVKKEGQ